MKLLVTGGAGYIGSHTLIELLAAGHDVVVVDNLSNSSQESLKRVEKITHAAIPFHKVDISDKAALKNVFDTYTFDGVLHFAGLKAVGESVEKPLAYYHNNIVSTLVLCEVMAEYNVKKIVFSSSATVYGSPSELPLLETSQTGIGITNPYGQTKYMIEQILHDLAVADASWFVTTLRYFNPIGAHSSGLIGEDPLDTPNNLLPYVAQVAIGKRDMVRVFGDDYATPDGTGVRDYIHVEDLAKGHVAALEHSKPGFSAYNLGMGAGVSVLEIIRMFCDASGKEIPYKVVSRRAGDIAVSYASAQKAADELGWKAEKTILEAGQDIWRWQSQNPNGYR